MKKNIQPLIIDLANPSPATGVNNKERSSFINRLKVDLALALALVHHLAIGKNIPFEKIASMLSNMGEYLIIEFVPKEDEKVKLMLSQKKDIYGGLPCREIHSSVFIPFFRDENSYYTRFVPHTLPYETSRNMNFIKQKIFPFHIFLLPVFFIWHILNKYFVLIPIYLGLKYLFYYLALSVLLFLAGKLIFRNTIKAGCWTTVILIIFFFWGSFHDFLRNLHLPEFFVSWSFLLITLVVFIGILIFYFRKKSSLLQLNAFFIALTSLFLLMEAGLTIFKLANNEYVKADPAYYNAPLRINTHAINEEKKPDIFFIVFDEYTSSKALKQYFDFDNSAIDSSLLKKGFYIVSSSQSNYNATTLSIASTFNMQYFTGDLEKIPDNTLWLMKGAYSFRNSLLPQLLEKQGYKILNYGLMDIKDHPIHVRDLNAEDEARLLFLETLWGRIKKEVLWNFIVRMPGYSEKSAPDKAYIARNQGNYTHFTDELKKDDPQPRLVVGHLLLPHRPAYLDRHGNPRYTSMEDLTDKNHDSLYLEQLVYTNTLIDSLATAASRDRKRPLVLIIEGDHGNRYSESGNKIREKQFMNLNAWYFSDKDYSLLYDSISPVNSFRVILNKYFDAGLPLLKDSTIRLR